MPSAAEKALVLAISRAGSEGLITEHTRRRRLTGMLGERSYFPAPLPVEGSPVTVVRAAVAGTGRVEWDGARRPRGHCSIGRVGRPLTLSTVELDVAT